MLIFFVKPFGSVLGLGSGSAGSGCESGFGYSPQESMVPLYSTVRTLNVKKWKLVIPFKGTEHQKLVTLSWKGAWDRRLLSLYPFQNWREKVKQLLRRIERLSKLFCSRKYRKKFREEQQICHRPWMDDWTAFLAMQSALQTMQTTTPVCFLWRYHITSRE